MRVLTAKNPRIVQDNLYANWHPWKISEFCGSDLQSHPLCDVFIYFFFRYDVPEGDRSERVSEADEGQTGAGRGILAGRKICLKIKRTGKVRLVDPDLKNPDASFYLTRPRFYVTSNL
jgi:hypothetical protein